MVMNINLSAAERGGFITILNCCKVTGFFQLCWYKNFSNIQK